MTRRSCLAQPFETFKKDKAAENAIQAIKNLPDSITLNDEAVIATRQAYDNLTERQRKRVHHIFTSKLIRCENDLQQVILETGYTEAAYSTGTAASASASSGEIDALYQAYLDAQDAAIHSTDEKMRL